MPIDGSQLYAFYHSIDLEYVLTILYENNLISICAYYIYYTGWLFQVSFNLLSIFKDYYTSWHLVRTVKVIEIDILMGCHCTAYTSYHTIISCVSLAFKIIIQELLYLRHLVCTNSIKMYTLNGFDEIYRIFSRVYQIEEFIISLSYYKMKSLWIRLNLLTPITRRITPFDHMKQSNTWWAFFSSQARICHINFYD